MARYESLGLLANPFLGGSESDQPGVQCEIEAAGNRLLRAIIDASQQEAPKPIRVDKHPDLPSSYPLAAIAHAERSLATDDSLNVLYAYVQLFMFKIGVTRATLGVIAERLAFREFEQTLIPLVRGVLDSPDHELASYAVMGPDILEAFKVEFEADPLAAVRKILGEEEVERHEELIEVADLRKADLDEDVDEDETTAEIDETVGDAPGTALLIAKASVADDEYAEVRDYLIEYVRENLSPVIARGLRLYRERGLAAVAEEFKITKAPRKTLSRLIELALGRFSTVALIYDDFSQWLEVPVELRSQVTASLANIRWQLAGQAVMVLMLADGEAPELEETFSGGPVVPWHFDNLVALQDCPEEIVPQMIEDWIASATIPGAAAMHVADSALATLVDQSEGSLSRFITLAAAAIEDAAARQASCLDDDAVQSALGKA